MKLSEKKIIKMIREEYVNRLLQLEIAAKIAEAQLMDQRGNVLVSPDLKVKHKESGYEYTVDRVEGEGENAIIYLRKFEKELLVLACLIYSYAFMHNLRVTGIFNLL